MAAAIHPMYPLFIFSQVNRRKNVKPSDTRRD